MAPQGTIQVDNPTPEEIVAERRKAAGTTAAPAPSAAPGPPPSIQVSTPTGVELKGDWRNPGSSLFTPPPKTPGVDYRTPLGGPPLLSSVPESIRPYIKGGLEIGGALLAQRFAPVKAAWELPAAVRMAWMMATAGTGAAAGSVANDTLVGPPPPADLPPRAFIETPPVGSDGRPRVNIQPPLEVRTPGAPPTVGSRARAAFVAGAEGELGGQALGVMGKGTRRLLAATKRYGTRPLFGALTPEGEEVASSLGVENVRPSSVNPSHSVDVIENVFKNSLFGGGRYRQMVADEEQAVLNYTDRLLTKTLEGTPRRTKAEVGQFWQAVQDEAEDRATAAANKLYDDVDALSGGVKVAPDRIKARVAHEVSQRGALGMELAPGPVKSTIRAVEHTTDAAEPLAGADHLQQAYASAKASGNTQDAQRIDALLRDVGLTPDTLTEGMTFRQAREVRSALGRRIRAAERSGTEDALNSVGFLKKLREDIDTSMTEAAGGPDTDLRKAFDTATKAWREMKQTFNQGVLKRVAKAEPHLVMKQLIRPHDVPGITLARTAVGERDWKHVAAAWVEDIFKQSTGELRTGKEIYDTLQKYGPETLEAILPRATAQDLWQVARVLKQTQRTRANTLNWMIPGMQLTAAAAVGAGVLSGGPSVDSAVRGVLLLGAPAALAKIVFSPTGRQLLTTGLKAKSAGDIKTATRLAGQLAAWMEKEGLFARLGKGKGGGAPAAFAEVPPQGGRQGGPGPRADGPPRVSP